MELELVEADEAVVRVHGAVVVHHGGHEACGEGVAVQQGEGWHGVAGEWGFVLARGGGVRSL